MSKVKSDTEAIGINLEEGEEKLWCACGLSSSQPFCDGSHSSTDIRWYSCSKLGHSINWLCSNQNMPYQQLTCWYGLAKT